uniref:POLAc domain-containing protein n=1 Tax=Heterorhabditis bacteriophora TaxID=37862 RepID=A0A1I7WUR3_HETBA
MGSKSLAKCIGVSVEEAERLISNFFSSFPKVKSYINNLKDSADEKGYVSTMLGWLILPLLLKIIRLCHALSKEVDSHPGMQPFEAHVPFTLQFFIDYCIFGMDEITFKIVYLRSGPKTELTNIFYEGVNLQKAADSGFRQSPLPPITLCVTEYDAWAEHIMNAEISGKNEYSSNPGLEYIWKEETARCRIQGTIPEDKFNHYTPRPYYKNIMEKDLLSKVKDIARSMREHGPSNINLSNLTQRLDVIPDQKSVILESLKNEVLETWTCQIDEKKSVLEIEEECTANIEDAQKSDLEDDIGIEDDEQHMNHLIATVHYKGNKDEIGETTEPHEWASKKRPLPQWFSLDKDLPLMVRNKIGDTVDDNQLCVSTDVTMSFDDASFRQTDPILGFSLCVVPDVCRFSTPSIHVFMSTLPVEVFFNGDVMWAENEYSLLESLVNLIRRYTQSKRGNMIDKNDPDMLFGYDTDRLSWGYVFKRAEVIGYSSLFEDLSRFNNVSHGWQRLTSTGVSHFSYIAKLYLLIVLLTGMDTRISITGGVDASSISTYPRIRCTFYHVITKKWVRYIFLLFKKMKSMLEILHLFVRFQEKFRCIGLGNFQILGARIMVKTAAKHTKNRVQESYTEIQTACLCYCQVLVFFCFIIIHAIIKLLRAGSGTFSGIDILSK